MKKKEILFIVLLFCLDQGIKFLMENFLMNGSIVLVPNFFSLEWLENKGAAWSIFENQTFFFDYC